MRRNFFASLVITFAILSSISFGATYGGGSGTAADPYQIASKANLLELAAEPSDYNKCFILTADIDLAGYCFTGAVIASDTDSAADDFQGTVFTGVFDGGGYEIHNLTIAGSGSDYVGLFGCVGTNGQIKKLAVVNVDIKGYNYVGGLVGWNYDGTVNNCYTTGAVSGSGYCVGGLAGCNRYGTIYLCCATGAVSSTSVLIGGLAGENDEGTISWCYATGNVSGHGRVGGLVGENEEGELASCYATGDVRGQESVGGLAGDNDGMITFCYATNYVSGNSSVGGLAGYNYGTIISCYATGAVGGTNQVGGLAGDNDGTITSCYSMGAVSGTEYVGGLVGKNYDTITTCYSTGAVSGTYEVGGLVGWNPGTITSCFWDTETSGQTNGVGSGSTTGLIGKTTGQMQMVSTFTYEGWDFVGEVANGEDDIWDMPVGGCYPVLDWRLRVKMPEFSPDGGRYATDQTVMITCSTTGAIIYYTTDGADPKESDAIIQNGGIVVVKPSTVLKARAFLAGMKPSLIKTAIYQIPYSGGEGSVENPYKISSTADWIELMNTSIDWAGKYFVLTADIDMAGVAMSPVGYYTTKFTGVFDGNGYTISNVVINTGGIYVGLFGYVGTNGQIKNLGVENVNIKGRDYVGGLVGRNDGTISYCHATGAVSGGINYEGIGGLVGWNSGSISLCYATGFVSGSSGSGGLVGTNYGTITSCYATGVVSGNSFVGGLVGNNHSGSIHFCYSTGAVSGYSGVGGLVGNTYGGTISSCYATGSVNGTGIYSNVGGLVGCNDYGTITSCYATGAVSGTYDVGGLVGWNDGGRISLCYATGAVSGTEYVGGLVGNNDGMISSCYATGSVNGTGIDSKVGGLVGDNDGTISSCYATGAVSGTEYVGGLVGYTYGGTITSCFWDIETSGQTNGVGFGSTTGVTGKTTPQMQTVSTFTDAGWDFVEETANGTCNYWMMEAGVYPKLAAFNGMAPYELEGSGTQEAPYLITDANDLGTVWYRPGACYELTGDIDLSGIRWNVAVILNFWGQLDGKGFRILNLSIEGDGYLGLIGKLSNGGAIGNLGVDVIISGSERYIGGLVGYNDGTITSCYSTGTVNGRYDVGGLVGNNHSGSIHFCYSIGAVSGYSCVGGLVGWKMSGTITFCYATSSVSGYRHVGGLVGENYDTIATCYSTGNVSGTEYVGGLVGYTYGGTITSCYANGTVSGGCNVGGLVGDIDSIGSVTITECYATGAVSATRTVGGLVGGNYKGTISKCYATGAVSGQYQVGGLSGWSSHGIISSCYATGNVSGSESVGGLVGENYQSKVIRCYSTGKTKGTMGVGGFCGSWGGGEDTGNFWDVETSGTAVSAMGVGKTTAQMKMVGTFAGWDFVNGTNDNQEHTWFIREGQEYPRLMWEIEDSQSGLFPMGFVTINKARVGRTSFEYEVAVIVRNRNAFAMNNVQMKLMDWDAAVQSVSDDSITIDTISAGATVTSVNTFKIIVDRSLPIVSSRLTWELTYYTAASGGQVQQAMMSMPLSALDAIAGDITGDGKVNLDDFVVMSSQWNSTPGSPSADIALPPDNYIGIEDLMYLAENWLN